MFFVLSRYQFSNKLPEGLFKSLTYFIVYFDNNHSILSMPYL